MDSDIPARIEIMRLKQIVAAMAESLAALMGNSNVLVVADTAQLSTLDASQKAIVFMKANDQGEFGIYFPVNTTSPADGVNIVIDVIGDKFELYLR